MEFSKLAPCNHLTANAVNSPMQITLPSYAASVAQAAYLVFVTAVSDQCLGMDSTVPHVAQCVYKDESMVRDICMRMKHKSGAYGQVAFAHTRHSVRALTTFAPIQVAVPLAFRIPHLLA